MASGRSIVRVATAFLVLASVRVGQVQAGQTSPGYKVLAPLREGNLSVFPVVAANSHNTEAFLTLDEGVRSGEVVVTESGSIRPLIRRRPSVPPLYPDGAARVNQLVLVNHSKRPLLLLAGEIVTGGKQDRIIAKDRLVPAESDPIDLGVFCVEPGRWVEATAEFGAGSAALAAPSVRARAMADKDQQKVWAELRRSQRAVIAAMPPATADTVAIEGTTSYARVMDNQAVRKHVDSIAAPIESSYRGLMKQWRDTNAVGVVVAVNGEFIWADIFASTGLFQKYWPKLVRSYAAEAMVSPGEGRNPSQTAAQAFLDNLQGRHEVAETEPGLYCHTEISGDGFKVFKLRSLVPKAGFDVHIAKMAE